jgi:choline dehydrogenase
MSDAEHADYIVIGSGAGGGPLAANLALKGFKVLLLEAGDDICQTKQGYLRYGVPAFHAICSEYEQAKWDFWVHHYSDESRETRGQNYCSKNKGIWYPRAGTLGGCTAHNAMITVVPQASDWDNIAQTTGDPTWCANSMQKYWTRLERCGYMSKPGEILWLLRGICWSVLALLGLQTNWRDWIDGHGFGGWLPTSRASPKLVLGDFSIIWILLNVFLFGWQFCVGSPLARLADCLDVNNRRNCRGGREGMSLTTMTTHRGRRYGPREFIREVESERPELLIVRLNTLATRIIFEGNRAVGVCALEGEALYDASPLSSRERKGRPCRFMASKEVILCAGAFNSPQLLMLSGIGPKEELCRWKIPMVVERAGVGKNLQDRYEVSVVSRRRKPFLLLRRAAFPLPDPLGNLHTDDDPGYIKWLQGKGIYCSTGSLIGIITRSSTDKPEPDLFILGFPGNFTGYFVGYSNQAERFKDKFSWVILKAYTENTAGQVTLESDCPRARPRVEFKHFDEGNDTRGEDLKALLEGIKFVRRMNQTLGKHFQTEIVPGPDCCTDAKLKDFIENIAWGHHASCTNKMGAKEDALAVVDSNFRVHGTEGLRVVDASVFPRIPGYFIVAAVYMISEKAVDVIVKDAVAGASPT